MAPGPAPPWHTTVWLNSDAPLGLDSLAGGSSCCTRSRCCAPAAWRMPCRRPGGWRNCSPTSRSSSSVCTPVFEHHEAMGLPSLRAFVHEYRIRYPVGVDMPSTDGQPIPRTMLAYEMQGTPTTVLIDAQGRLRWQQFGVHDDLLLGAQIATLLGEVGVACN